MADKDQFWLPHTETCFGHGKCLDPLGVAPPPESSYEVEITKKHGDVQTIKMKLKRKEADELERCTPMQLAGVQNICELDVALDGDGIVNDCDTDFPLSSPDSEVQVLAGDGESADSFD